MKLSSLTAISPIDGRYGNKVSSLRVIFSEYALMKFRVCIEIKWIQKLSTENSIKEVPPFTTAENNYLDQIILKFNEKDAERIKIIENDINHDVKSIEYFLKEKIAKFSELHKISEFVHFACTSEDINNLSYALMILTTRKNEILPYWKKIINSIKLLSIKYKDVPMLSRTHGRPATPSTIGKEMANVAYRMARQYHQLKQIEILGKINGAVGNYNAHVASYPNVDWHSISEEFVTSLGVQWNPYTTQIEPHDYIAEFFSCIIRFNTILIDFNQDIWGYIALNYFKQKIIPEEIGSSTMPHKINPIDFENSEANLGLANAILSYIGNKLPISRWQRDLTDSTILRNIGVGVAYSMISYHSTLKGIKKIEVNREHLLNELNNHWEVMAEPIQMVMKRYGIKKPYETLKELTHGKNVNAMSIRKFIEKLQVPKEEKNRLNSMIPSNYIGLAVDLVNKTINDISDI